MRRLSLLSLVAACAFLPSATSAQTAWTPPIGIPAPSFGITQVAPALPNPWTAEKPGFYYVAAGGSDSRTLGTPATPRASIPRTPGRRVRGRARGHVRREPRKRLPPAQRHRELAPVWIIGAATRPTATQKWIVTGSYYVIENINFSWANSSGNGKLSVGRRPRRGSQLRDEGRHGARAWARSSLTAPRWSSTGTTSTISAT